MTSLNERTVREIFEQAGSTAPAPGAGSVMAMAAAWGVALALKSIRITLKHRDEQMAEEEAALERFAALLFQDAEDDAAGFSAYIEAMRRPKSDPGRRQAIIQAEAAAARAALSTVDHARAAEAVCAGLEGRISKTMQMDLDSARALLHAAGRTASEDARESLDDLRAQGVSAAAAAAQPS